MYLDHYTVSARQFNVAVYSPKAIAFAATP